MGTIPSTPLWPPPGPPGGADRGGIPEPDASLIRALLGETAEARARQARIYRTVDRQLTAAVCCIFAGLGVGYLILVLALAGFGGGGCP